MGGRISRKSRRREKGREENMETDEEMCVMGTDRLTYSEIDRQRDRKNNRQRDRSTG